MSSFAFARLLSQAGRSAFVKSGFRYRSIHRWVRATNC